MTKRYFRTEQKMFLNAFRWGQQFFVFPMLKIFV